MAWVRTRREKLAVSSFFFQAEDGIRDHCVTGVQTWLFRSGFADRLDDGQGLTSPKPLVRWSDQMLGAAYGCLSRPSTRSEERRVGKECRSRWSPYDLKKISHHVVYCSIARH